MWKTPQRRSREWSSPTWSERIWNLQSSWKISYVNQRIDLNPRMSVAQCTRSSVVVAKEKIVQQTILERRREHSKHVLPSTEDRAPPPLNYQNISTRTIQATISSLKMRRYWIETPTGLPGESWRPSTSGPTNPPWIGTGVQLAGYLEQINLVTIHVTSQITSTVIMAPARKLWTELLSFCVVFKIHNLWFFVKQNLYAPFLHCVSI